MRINDVKYAKVYHDETAFVPGDKVFIYEKGNINGKRSVGETFRVVESYEDGIITFAENRIPKELKWNSQFILSCEAWERAYDTLLSNYVDKISAQDFKRNSRLSYASVNGELLIAITANPLNIRYYLKHSDGTLVGSEEPSKLYTSRFFGKRGCPEAVKASINKADPELYVRIPDKYQECILKKQNRFYAWNFNYVRFILKICPWLSVMKAYWATDLENRKLIIPRMKKTQLNERMGFIDDIPDGLVDKIWKEYVKIAFSSRNGSYSKTFEVDTSGYDGFPEEMTFVAEKGKGDDYYKAALYDDGTIHLNVDELSDVSDDEAKSSIAHELVHIVQQKKVLSGKRGVGEYGYNQAVNDGMVEGDERTKCLWMIEMLQETEIEARLSQAYGYVRRQMEGIQPKGYNMSDYTKLLIDNLESITRLKELEEAIKGTQEMFDIDYLWYINLFVKSAQAALYGVKQANLKLPEAKRLGNKLLSIYKKRFERYRRRVYNAVYQAVHDATSNKTTNEAISRFTDKRLL